MLRSQYEAEAAKGWVSVQTSFNFAWGSVKSDNKVEVGEGVTLLMGAWSTCMELADSPELTTV